MIISVLFTQAGGMPALGLTLADIDIYVYSRNKTTGLVAVVWGPQSPTQEIGITGQYVRDLAGADLEQYDYFSFAEYTGAAVLDSNYSYPVELPSEIVTRSLAVPFTHLKAALSGDTLEILRGDTLELYFNRLGNISTRTKLWFTVKQDNVEADTASLIQVEETDGLLYINGVAATVPANGSITVTNAILGNFTLIVEAVEAAKLGNAEGSIRWDVQVLLATGAVQTLRRGTGAIVLDSGRATS